MTCSPARLAANRANALKSTGPKEGKARSRMNALKHGLTAEVVRTEAEVEAAKPFVTWLDGESAVLRMRIDRAHQAEERERERAALRADSCWDDDRKREAERVARGIGRKPDRVVRTLRATVQGCAWMIERWDWLLEAAKKEGGWTAEQQGMASDLRGIPVAFRGGPVERDRQVGMAEAEIRSLGALRAAMGTCDAFERETTKRGLDDGATVELRRVIRYEAALQRRLRWCLDQQRIESPPTKRPAPVAPPPHAPKPPAASPVPAPVVKRDDAPARPEAMSFAPSASFTLPIAMIPAGSRPRLG